MAGSGATRNADGTITQFEIHDDGSTSPLASRKQPIAPAAMGGNLLALRAVPSSSSTQLSPVGGALAGAGVGAVAAAVIGQSLALGGAAGAALGFALASYRSSNV